MRSLFVHRDERGALAEIYRTDEVDHHVSLCYASWTEPGKSRGPHEHLVQSDFFGFLGPGVFRVYLWDTRVESETYLNRMRFDVGEHTPGSILVPPRVVHAYQCVSPHSGMVINLPDRLYKGIRRAQGVDEIRHEEREDSPFLLD